MVAQKELDLTGVVAISLVLGIIFILAYCAELRETRDKNLLIIGVIFLMTSLIFYFPYQNYFSNQYTT